MTIDEELAMIQDRPAPAPPPPPEPAPDAPAPDADPSEAPKADAGPDMPEFETNIPRVDDSPAGMFENIRAGWTEDAITRDRRNYHIGKRRDLARSMYDLLAPEAKQRIADKRWDHENNWIDFEDLVLAEINADLANDPARYANQPLSRAAFDAQITAEEKAELEEAQATLARPGGLITEFLGSAASTIASPTQAALMLLPAGVPMSALRTIGYEMALGGLSEAMDLPDQFATAARLDLPAPDPVSQVVLGTVLGGGFAGAVLGAARAGSSIRTLYAGRREATLATRPGGMDPLDAEIAVDEAEAALRGDQTVSEVVNPKPAPGTLGDVLAPANWDAIRNGIFAGESQGDYNALFGFSNRPGGKFANVRLTTMTVDQAIQFSLPSGTYARTVKGQIGRIATPMGAYQVVGTTLRAAKEGLGLTGAEIMNKDLQDRIGQWIYRAQGTGAWVGYKGPRTTAPVPVDGAAPASGPNYRTSRDYTRQGQVTAGDGYRIDVDYEVVDLSSLIRASGDLQPRDRSRSSSDAWIADTAGRLDPAQLMPSPTADRGAPIVGPDSIIESGNGRFGAIERAYELHPDRAGAYRAQIESAGYSIPEGVARPVLIARRTSTLSREDRIRFAIEAQDSGVAAMNPVDVARASSRAMTGPVLMRLDATAPLTDAANGDFVRAALAGLPRSTRNALFDGSGMLNKEGQRQLREALFARAWPDADILARFTETDAGELKSLMDALDASAPAWAALRADIEAGLVTPDLDIAGNVLDAMNLIGTARDLAKKGGGKISETLDALLNEIDLIDGPVPPLTVALVRKFWPNGRAAKAEDVGSFLTRYADDARKAGATGGMFDTPSPRDVLAAIDPKAFADLPADAGAARGLTPARSPEPEALPEEGFDAGATSPEAVAADAQIAASFAPPPALDLPEVEAPPAQAAPPAAIIADLGDDFAGVEIEMPDGTTLTVADVLEDLDADAGFDAFIQACALTPGGPTP